MIKYLILLFNIFGILIINLFSGDIILKVDAPNEVIAGTEFTVSITINKGETDGFARFQQELPAGFTAEVIDAAGSDFSFDFQKVKFFWLMLPSEQEITVKYSVKVDETVVGNFEITGLFSYIDGEKKSTDIEPFKITVLPASGEIADNTNNINTNQAGITIKRQKPFKDSKGNIIIRLLVDKGSLPDEQFAKIQEIIPTGYTAESYETKGAIFSYKDNTAKFLWMSLPNEQQFIVSYKLIPKTGTNTNDLAINGNFSYINDGITQNVNITETSDILAIKGNDNNSDIADNTNDNNIKNETVKTIDYKVQIAAGHKNLKNIKTYFSRLQLNENVNIEMHQGWIKYTVGEYDLYKSARDHRVDIWNKTKIDDAFVTAYNNGQRVTVQEALMIANQKWFQ
jgi:hypothetical protein